MDMTRFSAPDNGQTSQDPNVAYIEDEYMQGTERYFNVDISETDSTLSSTEVLDDPLQDDGDISELYVDTEPSIVETSSSDDDASEYVPDSDDQHSSELDILSEVCTRELASFDSDATSENDQDADDQVATALDMLAQHRVWEISSSASDSTSEIVQGDDDQNTTRLDILAEVCTRDLVGANSQRRNAEDVTALKILANACIREQNRNLDAQRLQELQRTQGQSHNQQLHLIQSIQEQNRIEAHNRQHREHQVATQAQHIRNMRSAILRMSASLDNMVREISQQRQQ